MVAKSKQRNGKSSIHVGDKVTFMRGFRKTRAVVVEDRGNVGAGGRHIIRIKILTKSPGGDREFEIPLEEVLSVN